MEGASHADFSKDSGLEAFEQESRENLVDGSDGGMFEGGGLDGALSEDSGLEASEQESRENLADGSDGGTSENCGLDVSAGEHCVCGSPDLLPLILDEELEF